MPTMLIIFAFCFLFAVFAYVIANEVRTFYKELRTAHPTATINSTGFKDR